MKRPELKQALGRLLGPAEAEIGCDACFDQLDRYVELELAGADADAKLPGFRAHLDGCPACREEHESLRALVGGEQVPQVRNAAPATPSSRDPDDLLRAAAPGSLRTSDAPAARQRATRRHGARVPPRRAGEGRRRRHRLGRRRDRDRECGARGRCVGYRYQPRSGRGRTRERGRARARGPGQGASRRPARPCPRRDRSRCRESPLPPRLRCGTLSRSRRRAGGSRVRAWRRPRSVSPAHRGQHAPARRRRSRRDPAPPARAERLSRGTVRSAPGGRARPGARPPSRTR